MHYPHELPRWVLTGGASLDREGPSGCRYNMNSLARGGSEHSWQKLRCQSPRSAAPGPRGNANKAPRIVPAIPPES